MPSGDDDAHQVLRAGKPLPRIVEPAGQLEAAVVGIDHDLDAVKRGAVGLWLRMKPLVGDFSSRSSPCRVRNRGSRWRRRRRLTAVFHADLSLRKMGELAVELLPGGDLHAREAPFLERSKGRPVVRLERPDSGLTLESGEIELGQDSTSSNQSPTGLQPLLSASSPSIRGSVAGAGAAVRRSVSAMSGEPDTPSEPGGPATPTGEVPETLKREGRTTLDLGTEVGAPTNDQPGVDLPHLAPGERIAGRFTILRFVARGGMGAVYEANDVILTDARGVQDPAGSVHRRRRGDGTFPARGAPRPPGQPSERLPRVRAVRSNHAGRGAGASADHGVPGRRDARRAHRSPGSR